MVRHDGRIQCHSFKMNDLVPLLHTSLVDSRTPLLIRVSSQHTNAGFYLIEAITLGFCDHAACRLNTMIS